MNGDPSKAGLDAGTTLKRKRQGRGISLETAHQHTRIPTRLLEALETNDPLAFPAPVYLRGFLKCYCEYLELDFEPLWREFSAGLAGEAPAPKAPEGGPSPEPARTMRIPLSDTALLPFLIILFLLLAGTLLWFLKDHSLQAPPRIIPAPPPSVTPVSAPADMTLELRPARETWIRLLTDGDLRFEGRVPPAAKPIWRAKKGFSLRASDARLLTVLLDGATVALPSYPRDAEGSFLISR
jgi:hypothetical protein